MSFINIHTHTDLVLTDTISIVNQYPANYNATIPRHSIGIHPWYINEDTIDEELAIIDAALLQKKCLALGECGLDKLSRVHFELQKTVFQRQIALAEKHQKPLIVHCVKAFDELLLLTKETTVPIIIHGFTKHVNLAKQLQQKGCYLSLGAAILTNSNLLKGLALDKIFLETDDNNTDIKIIYTEAAKQLNVSLSTLINQLDLNFKKVFLI